MASKDYSKLFTVAEVSKACDISRTSLIRLEESGFFKPCRIDPDTGYRYYDIKNVVEIGRYKRLRTIGLTRNEITDIFHGKIDRDRFLEEQRKKLNELQNFVDEFELLYGLKDFSYSFVTLPAITCYCEDFDPASYNEGAISAHLAYERVISAGYRLMPEKPPFILSDEWSVISENSPQGCHFTVCIHVLPVPGQANDPHLRNFPETKAISVSAFGDFSIIPDVISKLYEQLPPKKLERTGPVRFIVLATDVASEGNYIIKFIMPVNTN